MDARTYVHYTVAIMESGGLARGMYTRASAYESETLARELGPRDPHISSTGRALALALVRVETYDAVDRNGEPVRRLLRETILEVIR